MENQKLDNLLNLSLAATPAEREKSLNLEDTQENAPGEAEQWEVIVRYFGSLDRVRALGALAAELLNGYAVVRIAKEKIDELSNLPEILYIEMPKRLFFAASQGKTASCFSEVTQPPLGLSGKGCLVGIVDSGVDYRHPAFLKADGSTRILKIWDQTVEGRPPEGYYTGTEYTQEEINAALAADSKQAGYEIVPSRDFSGHGTEVLGIAAGSQNLPGGLAGMAPESDLLVVKLGNPREGSFPRTAELMQGVDYLLRQSLALNQPIAINLSFGNSYGSHEGDSLLSTYLDAACAVGRCCICTGSGNDAAEALHAREELANGEVTSVELAVGAYESLLNVQLWKHYTDQFQLTLLSPDNRQIGPLSEREGVQRIDVGSTRLLIYYGKPAPYSLSQEIYIDFLPLEGYVQEGIWTLRFLGEDIREGQVDLWLPGGKVLNTGTQFLAPSPYTTLTIPATAARVITVGAYDSRRRAYADFSGRGFTRVTDQPKPDLVAPGVNITTARAGGGMTTVTGTSFATPFVTGACALLMEWGIVKGRDLYLYGEKVKAYLRRGARPLPGFASYPNPEVGWGALCVWESLPV